MQNTIALLNEAKRKSGANTDYRLAKALAITSAEVSMFYSGARHPNEYVCMQIAHVTGRSFEEVTALVRLDAEKNETRREAWRKRLIQIGGIAASVALVISANVVFIVSAEAGNPHPAAALKERICIMLNLLWIIQGQTKLRMIAFPCTFGVFVRQVRQVTA